MNEHIKILAAALLAAEYRISTTQGEHSVTAELRQADTLYWHTVTAQHERALATATAILDVCDQLNISTAAATTTALLALRCQSVL